MSALANCIQTINMGIGIAVIVFTVRVYNGTKENALQLYDQSNTTPTPQNSLLYSTPLPNQLENNLGKYCQCGEEILDNICSEEQIISGCYDVSKKNEKDSLRRLLEEKDCDTIREEFRRPNAKYSTVFDFGFETVNKMALGILIIYACILGVVVLMIFVAMSVLCCGEKAAIIILPCLPCIFIITLGSGIADLVLHIILMVYYYKGRTNGDFLDYYNKCLPAGTEKEKLRPTYESLDNLNSNVTAFVVLNFVGIALNYVASCCSKQNNNGES